MVGVDILPNVDLYHLAELSGQSCAGPIQRSNFFAFVFLEPPGAERAFSSFGKGPRQPAPVADPAQTDIIAHQCIDLHRGVM